MNKTNTLKQTIYPLFKKYIYITHSEIIIKWIVIYTIGGINRVLSTENKYK